MQIDVKKVCSIVQFLITIDKKFKNLNNKKFEIFLRYRMNLIILKIENPWYLIFKMRFPYY